MTTLDRHIARTYLTNVVVLLVILFAIVLVADYSFNFDEYTRRAVETAGQPSISFLKRLGLSMVLVFDLWWPRFFQMYNFLLGLVLVGGMGFTLSQMVRHRELVAGLAGGISLQRLARPILAVALLLTFVQALNRELVVPRLADLLTREKWDAGDRTLKADALRLTADAKGRVFFAKAFRPADNALDGLWVWERDESGQITATVTADSASWDQAQKTWRLTNGKLRTRTAEREQTAELLTLDTDLDPTTLTARRYESYSQNLSTAQLTGLIERFRAESASPHAPGSDRVSRLERLRASRFSIMLCNLLALVVCMPFFLKREPTNMLVQALACAPVAIVCVMGSTLAASAAIPALPPIVASLVPVVILLPLAIAAGSMVKT
jgi:lipopolysaccharide export LptBFGC system permease protein LptF